MCKAKMSLLGINVHFWVLNSVKYGRHSLRYLGPKLWGKLSSDDRSAKILDVFQRCIRGKDLS